jgi:hypothetical protein
MYRLMQYENILKFVTKIVSFINVRALNKMQLLEDVNSPHNEFVMYNNIH